MSRRTTSPPRIGWFAALHPRFFAEPAVMVLVAANLLPLAGVLFWGWDLYTLMVLYWMETGVIGVFAIIQMAITARWFALFLVPFFCVHFGGFMVGHLLFLTAMFGGGGASNRLEDFPEFVLGLVHQRGLWIALVALVVSHGVSFVLNVLLPLFGKRNRQAGHIAGIEARETSADPQGAMLAPYGRVIIMHVTIIIGAMLSALFQSKLAAFLLLIGLKIAVDVAAHVRRNYQPVRVSTAPTGSGSWRGRPEARG